MGEGGEENARSPLTEGLIKNLKYCRCAGSRGAECNVWSAEVILRGGGGGGETAEVAKEERGIRNETVIPGDK